MAANLLGLHSSVDSGVPQGTVLGPLLFLVYVNDIVSDIKSEIRLFADDCILYRETKSTVDSQILQDDINSLFSWSKLWQMEFNVSKCHIMYFSRSKKHVNAV